MVQMCTLYIKYIYFIYISKFILIRAINWACYRTKNYPALMVVGTVKILLDYIGKKPPVIDWREIDL